MRDHSLDHLELHELLARQRWLLGLARGLLSDEQRAEDLAQDTWLRALERPPRDRSLPSGWLRRVAQRLAHDSTRREARRRKREEALPRPELEQDPAHLAARVSLQQEVVRALLDLPEIYRDALLLRYWEDLNSRQIAQRTQTPEGTVRFRQKRALELLRQRLSAQDAPGESWRRLLPLALGSGASTIPATKLTLTGAMATIMSITTNLKLLLAGLALVVGLLFILDPFPRLATLRLQNPPSVPPSHADAPLGGDGSVGAAMGGSTRIKTTPFRSKQARVDGVVLDADTGNPIAGATVKLQNSWIWRIRPRATADEQGRFSFRKVPFGHYLLTPDHNEQLAIKGLRVALQVATPGPLQVVLQARRASQLSGVLLGEGTGAPVPGVRLTFVSKREIPTNLGTTDAEGRFHSSGSVAAHGGRIVCQTPWARDGRELVLARLDHVPQGTITLTYAFTGVIRGMALNADDTPRTHEQVVISEDTGQDLPPGSLESPSVAYVLATNSEGRFQQAGLPLGISFRLTIGVRSLTRLSLGGVPARTPANARDLVLRLDPSTGVRGRLLPAQGELPLDIRLVLSYLRETHGRSGGPGALMMGNFLAVKRDGSFHLWGLQPGRYRLTASSGPPTMSLLERAGPLWDSGIFRVQKGHRARRDLRPVARLPISGHVGVGLVSGTRVLAGPVPQRSALDMDPSWRALLQTVPVAPDGSFVFPLLPRGRWLLQAFRPAPESDPDSGPLLTNLRTNNAWGDPLEVEAGSANVTLSTRPSSRQVLVSFQLEDPRSGNSVQAGSVLDLTQGRWCTQSGAEGSPLLATLKSGRHQILIFHEGCAPLALDVVIPADGREEFTVTGDLQAGRRISGQVRDATGAPVPRARVSLLLDVGRARPLPCQTIVSGLDGRFSLSGAPTRGGRLRAFAPGHAPLEVPISKEHLVLTLPEQP